MDMSIAELLLAEFEAQAPVTRIFLERLPEEKLSWKPHEKSMSAGQLALHLASVPGGVVRLAQQNPAQFSGPDAFKFAQPATREEILKKYDESVATVRSVMPTWNDAAMNETWRLVAGDQEFMVQPRAQMLRDIMLSHWYQHRGQFSVYLRMLNVAVPSTWGPSADEAPAFLQKGKTA
jgi:uncharacterized damage-inducible protein DinB